MTVVPPLHPSIHSQRQQLRQSLSALQTTLNYSVCDIIVSHCEINDRHGSGIFLQRIFRDSQQILTLRSHNLYDGQQSFGDRSVCIHSPAEETLFQVRAALATVSPQRLLVAPYFDKDFQIALAVKQLYDVPLCLFIMDDQNIFADGVPDALVQALVDKADLCLGISPALCRAYSHKFQQPFWFVPPIVERQALPTMTNFPALDRDRDRGVIIGNIWSQCWLDRLRQLCRATGVQFDWYGNVNRQWLVFDDAELGADGIHYGGYLPEDVLIDKLRRAPFAVIPTGDSLSPVDRPELARLSLPSRSCFMLANANLPLLVVGGEDTAIAEFVRNNRVGEVCGYEVPAFQKAIENLWEPEYQRVYRQSAFHLGKILGTDDLADWLWQSLATKRPVDLRFETLSSVHALQNASAVLTCSEVTQKHGTGALVRRIFPEDTGIISVRSDNHYGGDHQFGEISYYLSCRGDSRPVVFARICQTLAHHSIKRLFCVPYYSVDLMMAIAVKELFGIPMATYIMDDQNICAPNIPDELMDEFLSKCDVRFATHPELRDAYQEKYDYPFWILPAIAPDALVTTTPSEPVAHLYQERRGALIGSLWSPKWYQHLWETLQNAETPVDWYGNANYYWFTDSHSDMLAKGINHQGLFPEAPLVERLRQYPYVVVPTGTLDERDDQPHLSQLSLPGRIIFNMATANTPIVLLGSRQTSAAHFVEHFQIGVVSDYDPESFRQAVNYVLEPEHQRTMRQNAAKVARNFSDKHIDHWVWESLNTGKVNPERFENLFAGYYQKSSRPNS